MKRSTRCARYANYALNLAAPGASPEAAAAQAAFTVLTNLMSSATTTWRSQLTQSLAAVPEGQAKLDGIALDQAVGDAILLLRDGDGTLLQIPEPNPALKPGAWRPTPPGFEAGTFANVSYITPFTAKSASQFRPEPPPPLNSARYARDFNEIKDVGSAGPTSRTEAQSQIATYHWNEGPLLIAVSSVRALIAQKPLDLVDTSRLYALLFMICLDHYILP